MLLIEMSEEEDSEETAEEIEEELQQFEETFEELRIGTLLTGPYDRDNAIVTSKVTPFTPATSPSR